MVKRDIREHAFLLMKRTKLIGQKVPRITSATVEQVERYKQTTNNKHGPRMTDFQLDLAGRGIASLWNKRAAVLFTDDFLKSKKYECRDEALIKKAFTVHIVQLKNQYKSYLELEENEPTLRARPARRRSVRFRPSLLSELVLMSSFSVVNAAVRYAIFSEPISRCKALRKSGIRFLGMDVVETRRMLARFHIDI
jgi:hypothetical protein